jgi:hypothetical protein
MIDCPGPGKVFVLESCACVSCNGAALSGFLDWLQAEQDVTRSMWLRAMLLGRFQERKEAQVKLDEVESSIVVTITVTITGNNRLGQMLQSWPVASVSVSRITHMLAVLIHSRHCAEKAPSRFGQPMQALVDAVSSSDLYTRCNALPADRSTLHVLPTHLDGGDAPVTAALRSVRHLLSLVAERDAALLQVNA